MSALSDEIELFYGNPLSVISDCLRAFLVPSKGWDFIAADFSAVEARVLAWLAGQESTLKVFRGDGKIYEHAAALIHGIPVEEVTKNQRQIGKVAVLALGYQGGSRAFQRMSVNHDINVTDLEANKIKNAWRQKNPYIVKYWGDLNKAAWHAIKKPGQTFKAGAKGREVLFKMAGKHLYMLLPSNRAICYPFAELDFMPTPWDPTNMVITYLGKKLGTGSGKWDKVSTYGGKICENATQAVARCLLSESMLRLESKGYPIVMHVHDEVVCELPEGEGSVSEMVEIMSELPDWAEGLPIRAEGWRAKRYRK